MMDVSQKISPETKKTISSLNIECQVLQNLLKERQMAMQKLFAETLVLLGAQPTLYQLKADIAKDIWTLELKPDALVMPNRAERRTIGKN